MKDGTFWWGASLAFLPALAGVLVVVTAIRQNRTEGREEARLKEKLRDDEESPTAPDILGRDTGA